MNTVEVKLTDLQPSQLYICSEKLAAIENDMGSCSGSGADVDSLPVKQFGSRVVLTDWLRLPTRRKATC